MIDKPHGKLNPFDRQRIEEAAVLAFVPPTINLALGAALAWAIRGFRA
jgi:hypothetical protein